MKPEEFEDFVVRSFDNLEIHQQVTDTKLNALYDLHDQLLKRMLKTIEFLDKESKRRFHDGDEFKECEFCHAEFQPNAAHQRFCNEYCRTRAHKLREILDDLEKESGLTSVDSGLTFDGKG